MNYILRCISIIQGGRTSGKGVGLGRLGCRISAVKLSVSGRRIQKKYAAISFMLFLCLKRTNFCTSQCIQRWSKTSYLQKNPSLRAEPLHNVFIAIILPSTIQSMLKSSLPIATRNGSHFSGNGQLHIYIR